jgi:hypothetical protein
VSRRNAGTLPDEGVGQARLPAPSHLFRRVPRDVQLVVLSPASMCFRHRRARRGANGRQANPKIVIKVLQVAGLNCDGGPS